MYYAVDPVLRCATSLSHAVCYAALLLWFKPFEEWPSYSSPKEVNNSTQYLHHRKTCFYGSIADGAYKQRVYACTIFGASR